MGGVTDRTAEPILRHVAVVLGPTGVVENQIQVMTLRTHRIRTVGAQIRVGEGVGHQSSRRQRLAELVIALENMRIHRSMRTVGTVASKFAVVIAIVAVAAEYARSGACLLYTSPSPRDGLLSRMPSS